MTPYDNNNPFAKILRGEFPSYKVYENEHVLAFLGILPRCIGHTLVIPKSPARNILDISPDDFAEVAREWRVATQVDPFGVLPEDGARDVVDDVLKKFALPTKVLFGQLMLEENVAKLVAALK